MLQLDDFYKARFVLSHVIRKTELVHTPRINPDSDVYLKPECLQKTGSFKIRGAYYKISQLSQEEKEKGVIACSAGNHAQGVALGATAMGVKSLICLPEGAPISKVEATKRLGAEVCLVPGVYDDAYQKALQLKDECGYTFVHPFDDEKVIAGQGTIGLEILDQLPDVEAVVVPVGGGGLISGVAFAIKSLNPNVKVYGVQAEGAASMIQSLHDHKQEKLPSVATVADGIAVKEPGKITFETCSNYVDEIVTVSEDEIAAAILAETQWGITDPEILSAIRCHTTGKPGMSKLDKIIYLADMTSAERDWPGVDDLRTLEMQDLDRALCDALKRSIDFVEEKGGSLDPESVAAYEYAKAHLE